MKILHLLNSDKFSGAEHVVCQIISMFNKNENVEMVYCSPDGKIRQILNEWKIEFAAIKKMSINEVKRVIREQLPDIVHAHDFTAGITAACSTFKIPIISHLHSNTPWLKKHCIKSIVYGLSCTNYKRIFTVSSSIFNEFVFGKMFLKKLKIIGNPINVFDIREKAYAYEFDECFDIGFCGRLEEEKNPLAFLYIVDMVKKQIPDIKAAMVGDGKLKNEIENEIQKLDLDCNIKMYGFIENPYPIMKNFKLLCMPSLYEGFGLAAVEALSLGVPVVCSGAGGLSEIVDETCGRICTSIEEYTAAIEQLLNKNDYYSMRSKIFKTAERRDNIEKYMDIIISTYREIGKKDTL